MSAEVTGVELLVAKSINFKLKYTVSSGQIWTVSTNEIFFKDMSSICSLSMKRFTDHPSGYYHLNLKITFVNPNSISDGLDLIMSHNTGKKLIFHLTPESGNPNVFSINSNVHSENLFSQQNQSWEVRILYEKCSPLEYTPLIKDFKQLLESEQHTDFNIKTQNVTFKVHKGIVSCRCDVLAKAIESEMAEKQKNEIQLDDWDPLVVKELLTFIYTGSCEISPNPHHLFELAHYYQLDELKDDCSRYLKDNTNLKNIVHTLQLADVEQYKLQDLKILALSFVKNNESSLVKDMDFVDYLSKSIKIRSLVFILGLSYNYKLKGPLDCAKEFIKKNYVEVLENAECKNYLSSHADLLIDILKYSLESQGKA